MLWLLGETDGLLVTNWPLMLALFPLMIIGGGLEEAGWRGIVYDDSKYLQIGKVWAIAAMGIVWSIWHSPLWFIQEHIKTCTWILSPLFSPRAPYPFSSTPFALQAHRSDGASLHIHYRILY